MAKKKNKKKQKPAENTPAPQAETPSGDSGPAAKDRSAPAASATLTLNAPRFGKGGWMRTLFVVGVIAGLFAVAWKLQSIFNPLLLAALIAYVFDPFVDWLETKGFSRLWAIVSLYIAGTMAIVVALVILVPLGYGEVNSFITTVFVGELNKDKNENGVVDPGEAPDWDNDGAYEPALVQKLIGHAKDAVKQWNEKHPDRQLRMTPIMDSTAERLRERAGDIARVGANAVGAIINTLTSGMQGFFTVMSYLILVPLYTFFLLLEWDHLIAKVQAYLPANYRPQLMKTFERIHISNAAFFRGQGLICLIKGSLVFIGLLLFGVKFSFVFGLLYAVASLIPVFGGLSVFLATLIVTLIDVGGIQWGPIIEILIVFGIVEASEGLLLYPWILGSSTGLHPVVIILALFIFSALFGFFGTLLAVPLASISIILFQDYVLPILKEMAEPPPDEQKIEA